MKIKPLFDRIVIQEVATATKTSSGLVLPDSAQEKPQMAKVLAVGPGGLIDGKEIVMQIKVGDTVLYNKYAGNDFKLDGEEVTILKQSDVLAIVED
ncbi:MAG: co-chaperone GroES [Clostridia bacterium]|nr:co-chaperone GroES [Clostridia bacterium]MDE7328309.1 co-chaperone GroES [Clostridia bacterium]